jgi:hypothetical protein
MSSQAKRLRLAEKFHPPRPDAPNQARVPLNMHHRQSVHNEYPPAILDNHRNSDIGYLLRLSP